MESQYYGESFIQQSGYDNYPLNSETLRSFILNEIKTRVPENEQPASTPQINQNEMSGKVENTTSEEVVKQSPLNQTEQPVNFTQQNISTKKPLIQLPSFDTFRMTMKRNEQPRTTITSLPEPYPVDNERINCESTNEKREIPSVFMRNDSERYVELKGALTDMIRKKNGEKVVEESKPRKIEDEEINRSCEKMKKNILEYLQEKTFDNECDKQAKKRIMRDISLINYNKEIVVEKTSKGCYTKVVESIDNKLSAILSLIETKN